MVYRGRPVQYTYYQNIQVHSGQKKRFNSNVGTQYNIFSVEVDEISLIKIKKNP